MMRRILSLGTCLTFTLAMIGCGAEQGSSSESAISTATAAEDPTVASGSPTASDKPETVESREPSVQAAPYRDTLDTNEPGFGGLALYDQLTELVAADHRMAFDIVFYRSSETGGDITLNGEQVQLSLPYSAADGTPSYFSILADKEVLDYENDGEWLELRGSFRAAQTDPDSRTFELTQVEQLPSSEWKDEERCQAIDTIEEQVYSAAKILDGAKAAEYDQIRAEWVDSPQVWWAVKSTSALIADSNGEAYGDYLSQVCGDYLMS